MLHFVTMWSFLRLSQSSSSARQSESDDWHKRLRCSWAEALPYFCFLQLAVHRLLPTGLEQQWKYNLHTTQEAEILHTTSIVPNQPKNGKTFTNQSLRIVVASYLATFGHISDYDGIKRKIGQLNINNLTSYLASHQLVSQSCSGQLFGYFWPYLSHFKSYFDWI